MLNGSNLDVALGLVFSFLGLSLVVSALVEAINSICRLRAKVLREGIGRLLNDPDLKGLALRIYQHAAVNPGGVLTAAELNKNKDAVDLRHSPASIDSRQFAAAFMDVANLSKKAAQDYQTAAAALAAMTPAITALRVDNPQIADLLDGIVLRTKGKIDLVETEIARWFDASMDRLSAPFKRRTQAWSFVLAFALAGLMNIDAIRIGRVLWEQPALAENLKLPPEAARALAAKTAAAPQLPAPAADPPAAAAIPPATASDAAAAEAVLAVLDRHLPVGWQGEQLHLDDWKYWARRALGWFIMAAASLLGAPFWFDALQSVARLKGSAPNPDDNRARPPASA